MCHVGNFLHDFPRDCPLLHLTANLPLSHALCRAFFASVGSKKCVSLSVCQQVPCKVHGFVGYGFVRAVHGKGDKCIFIHHLNLAGRLFVAFQGAAVVFLRFRTVYGDGVIREVDFHVAAVWKIKRYAVIMGFDVLRVREYGEGLLCHLFRGNTLAALEKGILRFLLALDCFIKIVQVLLACSYLDGVFVGIYCPVGLVNELLLEFVPAARLIEGYCSGVGIVFPHAQREPVSNVVFYIIDVRVIHI